MKSLCATGLVLLAAILGAARGAHAQVSSYSPPLLPWPGAAPVNGAQPAGYQAGYQTAYQAGYTSGPTLANPNNTTYTWGSDDPKASAAPKSEFEQALHAPCGDECNVCDTGCCARWYGLAAGLVMGRNRANPYWTTFQTNNNPNQLMNTQNAGADWTGGGQFTIGYAWCGLCGPSVAFTYWGLGEMNGFANTIDQTGNPNTALSTPIDLGGVTMNSGLPASAYFDNASEHRIWRNDQVNNFEINGLTGIYQIGNLQMAGLAGFRYFRFTEGLTFGSVAFGSEFGDNGGADEAYLGFRCVNNLYGAQIGGLFNFVLTERLGVFIIPKVGVYGNQMNVQTLLYTGDEFNNPTYNIAAHKTDFSMISEIDTGFSWAFAYNWRAFIGYRLMGVNNVALADNQFLPFLADTPGFAQVKQSGSLILHGAFFGLGWMF